MYKLLLVDDDKALLQSFYELLDWNKFGFEVVARLSNGLEAFEYVKNNPVDVVVTDIRMPKMDGIELAGNLFEFYPDVEIVFVSAFNEFNYAKQAIKYGVADYISKPIMRNEVEELLQKLYTKLENRANNSGSAKLTTSKVIAERKELFNVLLGSIMLSADFFTDELAEVQMVYNSLSFECAVAVFEIMGMKKQIEQWGNDKNKLCEIITEAVCVDTAEYYAVELDFSENILAVLYLSKQGGSVSKKCVSSAIDALLTKYKMVAVNETFEQFGSFNEFKDILVDAKTDIMKYLKSKIFAHKDENVIYEVKKYVNEYYAEDINIKTIAKQCYFNEKYFGRQFKKVTGKTFSDYLNKVRIDKAKQMILSGEKVDTVCSMVGFTSRTTFMRQFLHYTGESPTQYRKNQMEKKL